MVFSARCTCHFCGKVGHKESECWNKKSSGDSPSSSDAQQSKKASNASAGSEPNPKQDGGSAPAQQQKQGNSKKKQKSKGKQKAAYSSEVKASSGHVPDIFGFPVDILHIDANTTNVKTEDKSSRIISLDSLANHSFGFCKDIISEMKRVQFIILGVNGFSERSLIGNLPCFGDTAYAPDNGKNGLALCEAESRYKVDRVQMEHYTVHITDDYSLRFYYDHDTKAYSCELTDEVLLKLRDIESSRELGHVPSSFTATVSENESKYSKREVQNSKLARRLQKILYFPSDATLIRTISTCTILNSPVNGNDIMIASTIYGKAPEAIAGKSKDHGPAADTNVYVPIDD
jgi:hypothetical protein